MPKTISGFALTLPLSLSMALALSFTLGPRAVGPAYAEIEYPWCAVYSEATVGATNCGFSTLDQCRAAISGIGGICEPNSRYVGLVPKPKRQDSRRYDRRN